MQIKPQPLYWCPQCRQVNVSQEGALCASCAKKASPAPAAADGVSAGAQQPVAAAAAAHAPETLPELQSELLDVEHKIHDAEASKPR